MTEHPITPPPELVQQWLENSPEDYELGIAGYIAIQAARWGSDQELEACCEWLCAVERWKTVADRLRSNRRPKPPSLKEQALAVLNDASDRLDAAHENIIRRALEALPE